MRQMPYDAAHPYHHACFLSCVCVRVFFVRAGRLMLCYLRKSIDVMLRCVCVCDASEPLLVTHTGAFSTSTSTMS